MANNRYKRLSNATIASDRAALLALKSLRDYTATNAAISVEALSALEAQLRQAEEAELLASRALAAARDARAAAGRDLHSAMLGVKAAVLGQFGPDSDAIQALGLKKKADYRRPARRVTTPAA